ncbi:DUF5689 domain-containing protein [Flammeovirga sp. EKP202]|uniref:DUF5689 domain-containing protein n=1 Tax=Flammeovirga sp. EKP202 TaxID=2770592 RepID=UPI00165FE5D5|nr:DUF5689 domain-containing protein [Flammeovirga sp. EKP202]MBD0405113.1 choice-of-anchor J domain-containing protein [Flammeovirga sp. EKP202]
MKQFILNKSFITLFFSVLLFGCVDKNYNDPEHKEITPLPEGTATMTIAELKALHSGRDNDTTSIPENTIIVGQVISDDEAGNIYKELYLQDETGGILIRLDIAPIYTNFRFGQEVAIICDRLVLGSYGGNVQLGIPSIYNGSPAAGRVPGPLVEEYMYTGDIAESVTTIDATVKEIFDTPDNYIGRRVRIQDISGRDGNVAFAVKDQSTNRNFNDNSGSSSNIIMRNSGYADFAEEMIPQGSGTVTAIVSVFNGTPQLYINNPAVDFVDFDGTVTKPPVEGTPPTVVTSLDEDFEGFTQYDDFAREGWNNIVEEGNRQWFINAFNNNSYANMTVYRAGEKRDVWLISPILDVEAAQNKTISFETRQEFAEGATLKVFVSADYDGSKAPSEFTWTEITARISDDGQSGYGSWVNSGDIDLSSYGNVVVGFQFEGEENVNDGGYSIDNFQFNQ